MYMRHRGGGVGHTDQTQFTDSEPYELGESTMVPAEGLSDEQDHEDEMDDG